jgi:putative SOS response-associated peptidase YedK
MCGRYGLYASRDELTRRFRVDLAGMELEPRYNVAPSQEVLTVAVGRDGARRALGMRWGFIPYWSKEPSTKLSTIHDQRKDRNRGFQFTHEITGGLLAAHLPGSERFLVAELDRAQRALRA